MIMSYKEAVQKYGNEYKLTKALSEGSIFRLEEGVYSTERSAPEIGIVTKKYPKAVITGEYAFYLHGLTNIIPEKYDLATSSKAAPVSDPRIRQTYESDTLFPLGITEKEVHGVTVRIYDKERMLIELLRKKNSMPYDLYKEILLKYREIINRLEIWRIQEYASIFPKSKMITKALGEEVM